MSTMPDGISYELVRIRVGDAIETTVYSFATRAPLRRCICTSRSPSDSITGAATHGRPEAIVGGFFLRDPYRPLGEVRVDGEPDRS